MHKIRRRAFIVVALVLALCLGLGLYLAAWAADGADWVALPSNRHLYRNGQLILGTITDRDGVVLAETVDGERRYAADPAVRRAMLHLVGDTQGRIGTGAQTKFSGLLSGYSRLSGLFFADRNTNRLALTASAAVSKAALEALGDYSGAVLAYNYTTGEILCAVSGPGFDPADVPAGLEKDPAYDGVFVNRCFGAAYTPGSVMKLVTAAAALETVPDILDRTFTCEGSVVVDGRRINCQGVHGGIDMKTALAKSCNCAFAEIAELVGGETLAKYFADYGLAESLDIDGIRTAAGRLDTWEDGTAELAWAGIGQSTDLVTPAAMLRFCGAIARGGYATSPNLLKSDRAEARRIMKEETAKTLAAWMANNTETVYGRDSFPDGIGPVCAKSGTAQIDGAASHSWFVGYVASKECPIAFAVVAEHAGTGSGVAKEIAAKVIEAIVEQ